MSKYIGKTIREVCREKNTLNIADMYDNYANAHGEPNSDETYYKYNVEINLKCGVCGFEFKGNSQIFVQPKSSRIRYIHECPICSLYPVIFNPKWNSLNAWIERGMMDKDLLLKLKEEIRLDSEGNIVTADNLFMGDIQKRYWWKCSEDSHPMFERNLYERLGAKNGNTKGHGCCLCEKNGKPHNFSYGEVLLYAGLKFLFDDVELHNRNLIKRDGSNTYSEIDIFLKKHKIGVEYDGSIYHESIEQMCRDVEKDSMCLKKGIVLIRVREINKWKFDSYWKNDNLLLVGHLKNNAWILDVLHEVANKILSIINDDDLKLNVLEKMKNVDCELIKKNADIQLSNSLYSKYRDLCEIYGISDDISKKTSIYTSEKILKIFNIINGEFYMVSPKSLIKHYKSVLKYFNFNHKKMNDTDYFHFNKSFVNLKNIYVLNCEKNDILNGENGLFEVMSVKDEDVINFKKSSDKLITVICPVCKKSYDVRMKVLYQRFVRYRKSGNLFSCGDENCKKICRSKISSKNGSVFYLSRDYKPKTLYEAYPELCDLVKIDKTIANEHLISDDKNLIEITCPLCNSKVFIKPKNLVRKYGRYMKNGILFGCDKCRENHGFKCVEKNTIEISTC